MATAPRTASHPKPAPQPRPTPSLPSRTATAWRGRSSSAATMPCRPREQGGTHRRDRLHALARRATKARQSPFPRHRLAELLPEGTPGVEGGDNSSLRLDIDNMPQPDAFLYILPSHGGQVRIAEDDYIEGRPNWSSRSPPAAPATTFTTSSTPIAATASASTRLADAGQGGRLVRPPRRPLRADATGPDGLYRSEVFPGLWLDPNALMQRRSGGPVTGRAARARVAEHAAFVARLRAAGDAGR